jgi:hypothetical protein
VVPRIEFGPSHGQAKLKRHIKAWGTGRCSIQLNPREIVNRISATLYKRQNPFESTLASGDSKGGAWFEPKLSQSDDVRKIKAAKAFVVGDI